LSAAPEWFRRALAQKPESATLDVLGCPIHYLRWGDRELPGIVLVHGGAAHAHWWSFIAPLLTSQYHVVALDLSGHGDSGRRAEYRRETWAEEVMAVARHAGIVGAPLLVGHSMGGIVCIAAAARWGDRLAGAIIVDSPVRRPDPESEEGTRGRAFRNPKTYRDFETAVAKFRLVPPQPCENDWIVDHVARHSLYQTAEGWTWKFDPVVFRRASPESIHENLAQVHCRVALFRGELSLLVTPDLADYMYELLDRNAPVVEIPQAHHHLLLDQPLAFVSALRAILADWEHSLPRRSRARGRSLSS
jgi:pimeloyl-ACP methyl ester carboxylesterase